MKNGKLKDNLNWQFVEPWKARVEDVELVHAREYVKLVEAVCRSGGGLLDLEDTVVSKKSYNVALYAVGGTLEAVNLVVQGKYKNAFALVRPPGHHASKFRACGFCVFNNVAVAAQFLLQKHKLKRVLILDIDAHHGNGTQDTFYQSNKVLYISLHEDPRSFPGTGFVEEVGQGEGLGYSVNVPLPFGTSDQIYLKAITEIAVPIIKQYKPQFILVSSGFDGHYADPVGNLRLSASCYPQIYKVLMQLTSEFCQGKIVSVLEGGYNTSFVGKLAATALAVMCRAPYAMRDRTPVSSRAIRLQGESIIKEVKRVQKAFWTVT